MIYITSDLHFFHDKEFIYKPRGFKSEEEMRLFYIAEWKRLIKKDDDIFVLGDLCLGNDLDRIRDLIESLPGRIHLIIGNHDTDVKIELYKSLKNIVSCDYATKIISKTDKYSRTYYLSHYPTLTASLKSDPKTCVINLHGHIHCKQRFTEDKPFLINVSVDANANKFITLEEIHTAFINEVNNCITY